MSRKKRPFDVGCYLYQKGYNKNLKDTPYKSGIYKAFIKEFYEPLEAGLLYKFEDGRPINLKEELDKIKIDYFKKK